MPRHAMTELIWFMTANWAQTTQHGMFFLKKLSILFSNLVIGSSTILKLHATMEGIVSVRKSGPVRFFGLKIGNWLGPVWTGLDQVWLKSSENRQKWSKMGENGRKQQFLWLIKLVDFGCESLVWCYVICNQHKTWLNGATYIKKKKNKKHVKTQPPTQALWESKKNRAGKIRDCWWIF